jgi:adenylate cyclase
MGILPMGPALSNPWHLAMAKEIERKFLVADDSWRSGSAVCRYTQGYLSRDPERIVRVRQPEFRLHYDQGHHAGHNTAGIRVFDSELRRASFDGAVPSPPHREDSHVVEYRGKRWEVDEFYGDNQGSSLRRSSLPARMRL